MTDGQSLTEAANRLAEAQVSENSTEHPENDLATSLAAAEARADESQANYLYALAEFENYKKRMERLLVDRVTNSKKALLTKFLPVIDNLERALSFEHDSEGLRGGLQATLRGFEALLGSEEVRSFTVLGHTFNPRVAEAIGTRVADDVDEDTIVEEVETGYTIGEELLRPAKVFVSKKTD